MTGNMDQTIVLRRLGASDLSEVKAFYAEGLRALARKEFFLPFTDPDLEGLIKGGGIAVGAHLGNELVGVSCIDMDMGYGQELSDQINYFYPHLVEGERVCEYSGVMTSPKVRRKGVAGKIFEWLKKDALNLIRESVLCAVVQLENVASLSFFYARGFRLVSVRRYADIDFGYLINYVNENLGERVQHQADSLVQIDFVNYPEYERLLTDGYVGVGCTNCRMLLAKF